MTGRTAEFMYNSHWFFLEKNSLAVYLIVEDVDPWNSCKQQIWDPFEANNNYLTELNKYYPTVRYARTGTTYIPDSFTHYFKFQGSLSSLHDYRDGLISSV